MKHQVVVGFSSDHSNVAAHLFWDAFSQKLSFSLGPKPKAISFLSENMNPNFALCALNNQNELIGIAGFKTEQGGLLTGGVHDLAKVYGWVGACWRGAALSLYERDLPENELLMDGIFVHSDARGQGVGTALLGGIKEKARSLKKEAVLLDVVDNNPKAKDLYRRQGFEAVATTRTGIFQPILGFRASTQMRCAV